MRNTTNRHKVDDRDKRNTDCNRNIVNLNVTRKRVGMKNEFNGNRLYLLSLFK